MNAVATPTANRTVRPLYWAMKAVMQPNVNALITQAGADSCLIEGSQLAATKASTVMSTQGGRSSADPMSGMQRSSHGSQRGLGARIMVRDIAGQGPLSVAVDKAKLPAATGGGVAYVRTSDVDPAAPVNRYDIRLRRAGADTLVTSGPLAKGEQVSTLCASDTLLAWAVRSPETSAADPDAWASGHLHVMTLATNAQHTIELDDNAWSLDLSCGHTFVAWGNGSGNGDPGQYVVDVPSGKLWKLGESPGISAVRAAGTMLGWTLPPKSPQESAPWRVTKWHGG